MFETIKVRGQEYTFKSYLVNANHQKIHVVEGGEGPLVILAHGFPESWYVWRFQMVELMKAGYRVAAITPRGFGRSSKPRTVEHYRITELAKDFAECVTALGEEKAYLVGHDWGSTTAWTAAWLYPEKFYGICGLSNAFDGANVSALPFDRENKRLASDIWAEFGNEDRMFYQEYFADVELAETELNNDVRAWLFNAFYGWSAMPPLPEVLKGVDRLNMTDEQMKEILRQTSIFRNRKSPVNKLPMAKVAKPEWMMEEDLDYIANQYAYSGFYGGLMYYKAMDLDFEVLQFKQPVRITIPAYYIGADRDWVSIWSRDTLEQLPSRCDDLRGMTILKDCGHWQTMEKADEVSAEILKFLATFKN